MTRLSHRPSAIGEYIPVGMKFDGARGGYAIEHTPLGQTVYAVGRFRTPEFGSGNNVKTITIAYGAATSNVRLHVFVCSSNRLTPSENNCFGIHCHNSSGVTMLFRFSTIKVTDNHWHSFLVSWNAATLEFVMKVDGVDVDDTTQINKVLTAGTISTTAGSMICIGQNSLGQNTNTWIGELTTLGCGDGYRTNWDDFFFPNNMPKRLDHAGFTEFGGGVYGPPNVLLDGSTGYYSKAYTSVGNKITFLVEFITASFTGGAGRRLVQIANNNRILMSVWASDHATPENRDRLTLTVQNGSGVNLVTFGSSMVVCDGQRHILFFSFDADLGLATFIIDSTNADWTGHPSRVAPTIGTISVGAQTLYVGCLNTITQFWNGSIGYFGHKEAYLTNWQDFMDGNKRREIDQSTWKQWRGQPKFWQSAAVMSASQGSEGAMVKNGTITIVPNSLPHLYHPYCDMENNLGLTGPMRRSGMVAPVVTSLPIKATKDAPQNPGLVLLMMNPRVVSSNYFYDNSNFQCRPQTGILTFGGNYLIDANGYAYKNAAWDVWVRGSNSPLPAKATSIRMYQIYFRFEDISPPGSNPGVILRFNYVDGNNFYLAQLYWNGSAWWHDFAQYLNGVWTPYSALAMSSAVQWPMHGSITVFDGGDTLNSFVNAYEVDVPSDQHFITGYGTTANRPLKNETGFEMGYHENPAGNMRFRGIMIADI